MHKLNDEPRGRCENQVGVPLNSRLVLENVPNSIVVLFFSNRLQTSPVKTTAFRVTKDLIKNGGFSSFYRGIVPRVSGHVPRSAWGMVVFQLIIGVSQKDPPVDSKMVGQDASKSSG